MARTVSPDAESAESEDSSSRRARLLQRRRNRTRVTVVVLAVLLVLAGAAVAAFGVYRNDEPAAATPTPTTQPSQFGQRSGVTDAAAAKKISYRPLDHAHPLKLWVGGDSLAGSFGFALGDQTAATGVVETTVDYKVSSGLWSNDLRNWQSRTEEQMFLNNPEVVVFMIGANDTVMVNKVDANNDGVADWVPTYRAKVAKMMDTMVGTTHRTVLWLGSPPLGDDNMNTGAEELDQVMQEEAAKRSPDVVYLDDYKLFLGSDGQYARRITDEKGNEFSARIGDGVHFTPDGAAYLARAVFALVDGRWRMTAQADPKQPIQWKLASGSGETVPGYSGTPQSKYRSNRNTSNYTTPKTYSGNNSGNNSTPTTVYVAPPPTTPVTEAPPVTDGTPPKTDAPKPTPTTTS